MNVVRLHSATKSGERAQDSKKKTVQGRLTNMALFTTSRTKTAIQPFPVPCEVAHVQSQNSAVGSFTLRFLPRFSASILLPATIISETSADV